MPAKNDFPVVFEQLKQILEPYAAELTVTADTSSSYSLDGPFSEKWQKPIFFGAVQIKKIYVSFYLMPVYMFPDLLKDISPKLKKCMQGKSCFNFKKVESELFEELATLTRQSFEGFQKAESIQ
ncbi:MAG TPA: hypothetical protein VFR47_09260 [Anaerolineales bacterium]|nr:hypothetical protein [Anaerolineales bacterium]